MKCKYALADSLLIVNKKLVNYIFNDDVVYIIDYLFFKYEDHIRKNRCKRFSNKYQR
jgi:hypothetical protein